MPTNYWLKFGNTPLGYSNGSVVGGSGTMTSGGILYVDSFQFI